MEKHYPPGQSSLLLLQPHPAVANQIQQAVSAFNCRVKTVNDERELFRHYQNNFTNPFGIFGEKPVNCLVFNLAKTGKRAGRLVNELKNKFEKIPPVIGLSCQHRFRSVRNNYQKHFDDIIVFPSSTETLRNLLGKYITKPGIFVNGEKYSIVHSLDQLPVVNLRTYSVYSELASRQQFPMNSLFNSFLNELEDFIKGLIKCYEEGLEKECERLCVAIKSLGRTLGASQLAQAAKCMEVRLMNQKWPEAGQWLPEIIERYLLLRDYLQQMHEKEPTKALHF